MDSGGRKVELTMLTGVLLLQVVICLQLGLIWRQGGAVREASLPGPPRSAVVSARLPAVAATNATAQARQLGDERLWVGPSAARAFSLHEMQRAFDRMDRVFDGLLAHSARMDLLNALDSGWDGLHASPGMDMRDSDDFYVLCFSMPDVPAEEVTVSINGQLLTILAPALAVSPTSHSVEWSTLERRFRLPGPVGDVTRSRAGMTNGVLRVVVPKSPPSDLQRAVLRLY